MRAYTVVVDKYEESMIAIVADSAKEARLIAYHGDCDLPWIEIKPKWAKNVDVSGLRKGVVSIVDGLKAGLYGLVEGECPKCKRLTNLYLSGGGSVLCAKCCDAEERRVTG